MQGDANPIHNGGAFPPSQWCTVSLASLDRDHASAKIGNHHHTITLCPARESRPRPHSERDHSIISAVHRTKRHDGETQQSTARQLSYKTIALSNLNVTSHRITFECRVISSRRPQTMHQRTLDWHWQPANNISSLRPLAITNITTRQWLPAIITRTILSCPLAMTYYWQCPITMKYNNNKQQSTSVPSKTASNITNSTNCNGI